MLTKQTITNCHIEKNRKANRRTKKGEEEASIELKRQIGRMIVDMKLVEENCENVENWIAQNKSFLGCNALAAAP